MSDKMLKGICFLLDSGAILLSGIISYLWIVGFSRENIEIYAIAVLFIWIANFMLFHYGELYKFEAIMEPAGFWDKFLVAYAISFMMFFAIAFSFKVSSDYSRIWMYAFAFSGGLGVIGLRLSLWLLVIKLSDMGLFARNVVVVGSGEQARRLLAHIAQTRPRFISVIGVFDAQKTMTSDTMSGFPILGGGKGSHGLCSRQQS